MKQLILLTLLLLSACGNLTSEEVTKLTKKAENYLESQQYPQAILHYEKVAKGYIDLEKPIEAAQTYHKIADIYKDLVIYDSVHASYQKAIALYQEINEIQGLSNTYQQIGVAHQIVPDFDLSKNYDSAQIYFSKALDLKKKHPHSSGLNRLYYNLGTNYLYQEKYDSAIYFLDNSINLSEKTKVSAENHFKLGEAYLKTGKYQLAEKHLLKAHIQKETVESGHILGKLYSALGKVDIAKGYLDKAYQLATDKNDLKQMFENRLALKELFSGQKQYQKASDYFDQARSIADLEYEQNKAALNYALEMKHEIHLKIEEELLKNQNSRELAQYQNKLIGVSIFATIILILCYILLLKSKRGGSASHTLDNTHKQIKNMNEAIITQLKRHGPQLKEASSRNACRDMSNRTIAIELVNSRLYKAKNGKLVGREFGSYLNDIVENLIETHDYENIKLNFDVPKLKIPLLKALPIGMILNELVTNCFKYAWQPVDTTVSGNGNLVGDHFEVPQLWVQVKMMKPDILQLLVADNGHAPPDAIEKGKDETSGRHLLSSLTEELGTELIQKKASGTSFEFTVCLE